MIEVTPETACMIYLGITAIALLCIWLRKSRKSKDVITFSSKMILCEFCHLGYIDDTRKSLTRCPHCQFLNKHLKS